MRCRGCKLVYRTVAYHRSHSGCLGYRFRNVEITEDVRDKPRAVAVSRPKACCPVCKHEDLQEVNLNV
jgi:hypothetical protein